MADSPAVRSLNSSRPRSSERAPSALMPVPGLLKVSTVVVPPCAAAMRVLAEPIRMLRIREAQMGMDVDHARQHQQAGRVDDLGALCLERRTDALDAPIGHRDVGDHDTAGHHHRAADDDHVSRHRRPAMVRPAR